MSSLVQPCVNNKGTSIDTFNGSTLCEQQLYQF